MGTIERRRAAKGGKTFLSVDLPVEGATKYELVINAKTAQAVGFKPPQSFMVRVDRQVE